MMSEYKPDSINRIPTNGKQGNPSKKQGDNCGDQYGLINGIYFRVLSTGCCALGRPLRIKIHRVNKDYKMLPVPTRDPDSSGGKHKFPWEFTLLGFISEHQCQSLPAAGRCV